LQEKSWTYTFPEAYIPRGKGKKKRSREGEFIGFMDRNAKGKHYQYAHILLFS